MLIQAIVTPAMRVVDRPEGRPAVAPMPRCTPWKGRAIPCAVRLAWAEQWGSEPYTTSRMAH
jgi:hypothetical protein